MNVLSFAPATATNGGRRLRRARFQARSLLAVGAACLAASAVRETLAAALETPVTLRLMEPSIPNAAAWTALTNHARHSGLSGPLCEAAIIARPADALMLAALVFGEADPSPRELSALEQRVIDDLLPRLAASLGALCGQPAAPCAGAGPFQTYFDLLIERPAAFRLGVALSCEPSAAAAPAFSPAGLAPVELELRAELARGRISARQLLALRPGTLVPMITRMGDLGALTLDGHVLARGECGEQRGRGAIRLEAPVGTA